MSACEVREILITAKSNLERSYNVPYPSNFSIGSWWKIIQQNHFNKILSFNHAEDAIKYCQGTSGFDHRIFDYEVAMRIINFKIKKLKLLFPCFCLNDNYNLVESIYSDNASLVEIDGKKYSSIFLTHLYYYLRSSSTSANKISRVIEIGGGYGALARIFKIMDPKVNYCIIDLPESLFYAYIFLSLNFPNARIAYIRQNTKIQLSDFDFVLIPIQMYEILNKEHFDIVINTGSLQEMPPITVNFWMKFIQDIIIIERFYSFNYYLNNKYLFLETSNEEANLICPILDPYWTVDFFEINPKIATVDACERNWLEICLKRIPLEYRNFDVVDNAEVYFQQATLYPKGSTYWFENIYMAIWAHPKGDFYNEMADGIEKFKRGLDSSVPYNNHIRHFYFNYKSVLSG